MLRIIGKINHHVFNVLIIEKTNHHVFNVLIIGKINHHVELDQKTYRYLVLEFA